MIIPSPDNPRALFHLFLFFDAKVGLPSIVDNVAFRKSDPRQICRAVLGRLPESAALATVPPDYDPAQHLFSTLHAAEFQKGIVSLFGDAFPEKRRRIFIHVPKCAGTDLIANLAPRYPSISWTLTNEERTSKEKLFSSISILVREALVCADLFIHGHMGLHWVLSQKLLREGDEVFTVVRDPAEMVLSQVNYVLMRLVDSAARPGPVLSDVRQWHRMLGIEQLEPSPSAATLLALAKRILHGRSLVPSNRLCRSLGYIGGGVVGAQGRSGAQVAYDNLVIANAEITDTRRYARWLRSKFGIISHSRHNVSRTVLSREALTVTDKEHLESIISEDRKIYDRIQAALALSDTPSVMADELGR